MIRGGKLIDRMSGTLFGYEPDWMRDYAKVTLLIGVLLTREAIEMSNHLQLVKIIGL